MHHLEPKSRRVPRGHKHNAPLDVARVRASRPCVHGFGVGLKRMCGVHSTEQQHTGRRLDSLGFSQRANLITRRVYSSTILRMRHLLPSPAGESSVPPWPFQTRLAPKPASNVSFVEGTMFVGTRDSAPLEDSSRINCRWQPIGSGGGGSDEAYLGHGRRRLYWFRGHS